MRVSIPASEEAGSPAALDALTDRLTGGNARIFAHHASKRQFIGTFFRFCHMYESFEQAFADKKAFFPDRLSHARTPRCAKSWQ
jgi:hypothetical protein